MSYHEAMKTYSPKYRTQLVWRNGKKVRKSRWMMEQELGRKLEPSENVHHINGDPLDNRIENLIVLNVNKHLRLHKQVFPDGKVCVLCGNPFQVNPRKRKRNKCCSPECAQKMRVNGRKNQAASLRT
jgi:hypothetical protein